MISSMIITGSEILSGFRQDSLIQPISAMLKSKGIALREVRIIGDDPDVLSWVVKDLAKKSDIILVTGGLGNTPDDTTHKALISLQNTDGESITAIDNPVGYAKGMDLVLGPARVVFMPGVPREALAMCRAVLETIKGDVSDNTEIGVFGLRETEIARLLGPLALQCAFLPKDMEVTLVVPASIEQDVRSILGENALEEKDINATLARMFKDRGLTCSVAESCTGGLIGHLITELPGSSGYFAGSAVVYSNIMKMRMLGVDESDIDRYGAVSEVVSRAMLRGVLDLTGADVGISTTGIAGPGGGTDEKPVGTVWISVGTGDDIVSKGFRFNFDRQGNKKISAKTALFMLRRYIRDKGIYSS